MLILPFNHKYFIFQVPDSAQEWTQKAKEFQLKWNYPCCFGALDGKHIAIQQPPNSGSEYFNYKHFFSVLFLALVDANYKFVYVEVHLVLLEMLVCSQNQPLKSLRQRHP